MLEELTRNLVHNAIRHSPVGAPLALTMWADACHVSLRVADHSPGVDEALRLRESLFSPFVTGDTDTGLGLLIAREIAHALGGHIVLDNRVDAQGTGARPRRRGAIAAF